MKSWDAVFSKVRDRSVDRIETEIRAVSLGDYSFETYVSAVPELINKNSEDGLKDFDKVLEIPDKRGMFVSEVLYAFSKFFHVLACTNQLSSTGALTWSAVESYHSTLFGAKAFLASFGILTYSTRGATVLVDFWPEFGRREHEKKFRKEFGASGDFVRLMSPNSLLQQKQLWEGVQRLCRVGTSDDVDFEGKLNALASLIDTAPWQVRHANFYSSESWTWPDDITLPSFDAAVIAERLRNHEETRDLMALLDLVFDMAGTLIPKFETVSGLSGLDVPPTVRTYAIPLVAFHST